MRGRQLVAQTNSKSLRLQAGNPTRGEGARVRASFFVADLINLDDIWPFKHARAPRATRSTWGQRVYNSGMNDSGRSSAALVAFALSTLAAAVVFSIAGTAHADTVIAQQLDISHNTTDSANGNIDTWWKFHGTALTGTLTKVTWYGYRSDNFGGSHAGDTANGSIYCFTDSGYSVSSCTGGGSYSFGSFIASNTFTFASTQGQAYTIVFDFSSYGIVLNPAYYYLVHFAAAENGSTGYIHSQGSASGPTAPSVGSYNGNVTGLADIGYKWEVVTPNVTTRIDSISPANASTTASTAVAIKIGYYVNAATDPNINTVAFQLYDITNYNATGVYATSSATTGALSTFTDNLTLVSGHAYTLQAYLLNTGGNYAEVDGTAQTTGTSLTEIGVSEFYVGSNPFPAGTGLQSSPANSTTTYSLATSTCSFTSVAGCFQNALVWALFPSQGMLTAVAQGGSAVKNKPPFGYLFVNIAAIQALNASGTPPVVLAAMAPITLYIFHPADVGLASIIFFCFGVWFFLRVRHIEL